jgi:hypothetical protein
MRKAGATLMKLSATVGNKVRNSSQKDLNVRDDVTQETTDLGDSPLDSESGVPVSPPAAPGSPTSSPTGEQAMIPSMDHQTESDSFQPLPSIVPQHQLPNKGRGVATPAVDLAVNGRRNNSKKGNLLRRGTSNSGRAPPSANNNQDANAAAAASAALSAKNYRLAKELVGLLSSLFF